MAQAAKRGWHVGGIDYYQDALNILESFLDATGRKHGIFINDDVFTFDWNSIRESVDLIASFGFLEHFKNPDQILLNASLALKPGGLVLSQIPNLFSFNAKLFKKYDRELWDQHVPYDPEQMDRMHTNAGLEIVEPASFRGGFDQYMLTPWEKIGERMPFIAYKGVRYFASYLVQPVMRLMPKTGKKSYCANFVGVYIKPTG